MDLAPDLMEAIIRIRESIDRLASSKGWARGDYRFDMVVNVDWGSIHIDLFAKEYDQPNADDDVRYDEVYDQLEVDLTVEPDIYALVGALIWPWNCDQMAVRARVDHSEIRIDDDLLNPGLGEPRPIALA